VNGIKTKRIDENTRKIIERAGDVEAQVLKAHDIDVLDREHYKKINRALKRVLILYPPALMFFFSYLTYFVQFRT
jgi:hypothetical protein